MIDGLRLESLQTTGFVVVPGFLSPEELEYLREDFSSRPIDDNRNYRLKSPSFEAHVKMKARVEEMLRLVNAQTNLRVDHPIGGSYFATGPATRVNFPWHQDHESFFELQNHYDYLNFYIPIVKPDVDKSNLSIVPFDVLQREAPRLYTKLVRGGASRFARLLQLRFVVCDDSGTLHRLPRDIDSFATTPRLAAGDLLLMRGDVIHRTQDAETERVALSFRAGSNTSMVTRRRLAAGGLQKALMMGNNPLPYQQMFRAFDVAGKNALPAGELKVLMTTVGPKEAAGRRQFYKQLLKEKLRNGVMSGFVASVSMMYGLSGVGSAVRIYYRFRQRLGR